MNKVVIAVVPGWAVGGEKAHVVCDMTIASKEHAIFKQTDDVASFDGGGLWLSLPRSTSGAEKEPERSLPRC